MSSLLLGLALFIWGPELLRGSFNPGLIEIASVCEVPLIIDTHDENGNGQPDALDIVAGARAEVANETRYNTDYYAGGFPPEGQGACTDVVWRGFQAAGYDLKSMLDNDIALHPGWYGPTGLNPDPNIDFRRCQNLIVYLSHHGQTLATDFQPWNVDSLQEWQPGDLVFFAVPHEHVGVVSDRRMADGVPYIIHNPSPHAMENDALNSWPSPLTGHYRLLP